MIQAITDSNVLRPYLNHFLISEQHVHIILVWVPSLNVLKPAAAKHCNKTMHTITTTYVQSWAASHILCVWVTGENCSYLLLSWIFQRNHQNPSEFPTCLQAYGSGSRTRGHLWDFSPHRSPKKGKVCISTAYHFILHSILVLLTLWLPSWILKLQ